MNPTPESLDLTWVCNTYYRRVHARIRRSGRSREDSEDLTQSFFYWLISTDRLSHLVGGEPALGAYLGVLLKRFLVNQWRRETRQKRGGGRATVPLEGNEAACVTAETPVRIAELRELREAMGVALQRLRRQCEAEGDGERFDQLSAFLVPGEAVPDGEAVAGRLGMNSGALRVAVHRLRKRYGQMCVDVDLGDLAPVGAARSRRQQVDDLLGIVSQC